jgi:hypothetical protein
MSRPEKNAEERRSRIISFRVTELEFDELAAIAARAGLPPNELARRLTLRRSKRVVIHTHRRCDPALLKRIDQIGNNLNQVVKSAHIFGRLPPGLEQLCEAIDALVTQAIDDTIDDP